MKSVCGKGVQPKTSRIVTVNVYNVRSISILKIGQCSIECRTPVIVRIEFNWNPFLALR